MASSRNGLAFKAKRVDDHEQMNTIDRSFVQQSHGLSYNDANDDLQSNYSGRSNLTTITIRGIGRNQNSQKRTP